jgi:hypothetical protein
MGHQGLKVIGDGPSVAGLRARIRISEACTVVSQAPDALLRQLCLDDEPVGGAAEGAAFQNDQRSAFLRSEPHSAQIPAADIDAFAPERGSQDGLPEVAGVGAISRCR